MQSSLYTVRQIIKAKVFNFYLQALSAKGWSPKGRRGKENTLPVKQQVGFRDLGPFGPLLNAFNRLATVSLLCSSAFHTSRGREGGRGGGTEGSCTWLLLALHALAMADTHRCYKQ